MSIRAKYGFGPVTVEVHWLDKCPDCGFENDIAARNC
jgi:hypothetical protein